MEKNQPRKDMLTTRVTKKKELRCPGTRQMCEKKSVDTHKQARRLRQKYKLEHRVRDRTVKKITMD